LLKTQKNDRNAAGRPHLEKKAGVGTTELFMLFGIFVLVFRVIAASARDFWG